MRVEEDDDVGLGPAGSGHARPDQTGPFGQVDDAHLRQVLPHVVVQRFLGVLCKWAKTRHISCDRLLSSE